MTFAFAPNFGQQSVPMAIPPTDMSVCRKRKGNDMDAEDLSEATRIRPARRMVARLPRSNDVATFHALPAEVNMKYLAAMGYQPGHQQGGLFQPTADAAINMDEAIVSASGDGISPSSTSSDFFPSTPTDVQESESYFTQQYRQNYGETKPRSHSASHSPGVYPDLDLYPHSARTPGLLGMDMAPSENDMEVDDGNASVHGPQCRSIPQLHVRSEPGVSSELWARCPDCNQMSKVDAPSSNSSSLVYSP